MKIQSTNSITVRVLACILALTILNACSKGFQVLPDSGNNQIAAVPCEPKNCVTLEWDPVTTQADGTPIVVSGYIMYYGPASGYYPKNIDVKNGTTVSIPNLAPGTYFFAVKAYIIRYANGIQSESRSGYSNEVGTSLGATMTELDAALPEVSVTIE